MKQYSWLLILLFLPYLGCSSLRIRDFPSDPSAEVNQILTSQISFKRNTIATQELPPPLKKDWEENYQSGPNNGFTVVNNWLLFGMYNGYLAVADIEDGDLKGKKNLGDACSVPPTVYKNILYQPFEAGNYGLIAYDISKGKTIWEIEKNFSKSAPVVIQDKVFLLLRVYQMKFY